jgi:hypothetical protein
LDVPLPIFVFTHTGAFSYDYSAGAVPVPIFVFTRTAAFVLMAILQWHLRELHGLYRTIEPGTALAKCLTF